MAKKHKHPEHENLERWLVSYADFITLLFATFTALYALSQTDLARMKDVAKAIREGFQEQSIMSGINSVLKGDSPPAANPDPIAPDKGAGPGILGQYDSMVYKPGEIRDIEDAVNDIKKSVDAVNDAVKVQNEFSGTKPPGAEDQNTPMRGVEVSLQERGVRISMDSRLLFPPGNAALRPAAMKFLDAIAPRLQKLSQSHMIHVEGHTDNTPISGTYPSNWELSAARASSVIRYFTGKHDFNPASLVAVGYASTQPLTTNDTAEGRNQNRRVDIIIYNEKLSRDLSPRAQFVKETLLIKSVEHAQEEAPKPIEIKPSQNSTKPKDPNAPVKVIIREADGTERTLVPKLEPSSKPAFQKDMGKFNATPEQAKPAGEHASGH